jgi:hypothetical protein
VTKITDSKGNEIQIGTLVRVKGSTLTRKVVELEIQVEADSKYLGFVTATRIDGNNHSWSKWLDPSKLEVVA